MFAAWAEPERKARWFGNPEDGVAEFDLDFRVGGREFNRGKVEGQEYTFEARYQDIVPDVRSILSERGLEHFGQALAVERRRLGIRETRPREPWT